MGKNGEDTELDLGKPTTLAAAKQWKWRFPSRSECMTCHSRAANFVLGVTGSQLNREHDYNGVRQPASGRSITLDSSPPKRSPNHPRTSSGSLIPARRSQDLELRARTYLHVNCSVYVEAGGGNRRMQLSLQPARDKLELHRARPQHDTFGITSRDAEQARALRSRSVASPPVGASGRGQMPPLVSNHVDEAAVKLFREWISGLKSDQVFVREWQMEDLVPSLDQLGSRRSFESGRKAFRETGCLECHRAEGQGGSVGPDLTGIGRRLRAAEVLESILLPSKVVADEYATILVETASGAVLSGRIEREDDQQAGVAAAIDRPERHHQQEQDRRVNDPIRTCRPESSTCCKRSRCSTCWRICS